MSSTSAVTEQSCPVSQYRFRVGQLVKARASGKFYRIKYLASSDHRKLKGEIGYYVVGQRDGKNFGPVRVMRESAFEQASAVS